MSASRQCFLSLAGLRSTKFCRMKIHFYVRFHTRQGQLLSVSGNIPALGNDMLEHAHQLSWLNNDYWQGTIEVDFKKTTHIRYNYVLQNEDGFKVVDWGNDRTIHLGNVNSIEEIQVVDAWNHAGEFENVFYSDPFQQTLLKEQETRLKPRPVKKFSHIFKVKAPLLGKNEVVCLLGNNELGEWNTENPIILNRENGWWSVKLNLPRESLPLAYKYGVYHVKEKKFLGYESSDNRVLYGDSQTNKVTILHDGFVHLPNNTWRAAGVSIPVFSLRSKNSFGTGEFTDLKLLTDWAVKTGLKLIQILPVNDTTATHTWVDTYPY